MEDVRFRVFLDNKMVPCEVGMDGYVHVYNEKDNRFEIVGAVNKKSSVVKQIHVMQFTGRYDKKDKPVYEGDIVKLNLKGCKKFVNFLSAIEGEVYDHLAKVIQGKVVYSNEMACFTVQTEDENYLFIWTPSGKNRKCVEIVGNIYENPKLEIT